jgi:tetratricopeptide (TPR) repeat protein
VRQEEQRLDEMRSALAALGDEVEREEEHIRQSYGARREIDLAKLEGREVEVPVEMGKHWWWPFGRSAVPAEAEPVKRAMEKEQGVAPPVARKLLWRLWPFGTGEGGGKVDVEAKCEELYKEARELLQQAEGKKAVKNWNEAFACYDRASVALMKLRKIWPEYRKDEVSRLLQGCRDGLNDVRTQRARQQYEELLADLEAALRKNPDDADALFSIGAVSYRYGRIEKAIESYKRVVSIRPRDAAAYYNLGAAYKDKGDLKEAASAFRKVIDINPDDAKAYYSLGVVYRELGDYKKACQKFEEALNADSSFAPAYFSLGNVYQANLGEPRMAVLYWKKYLKLNPHDPQAASLREWIAQVEASDTGGETTGERKTGREKRPGWKSWLKFWDRGAHAEEAEGKAG